MKTADIAKKLAGCAENVCRYLFPKGEKIDNDWCLGDINGTPGKSLKISLSGESAGAWLDFAGNDSGNLITLWERAHNLDEDQACREAEDWLGVAKNERRTATHWEKIQKVMRPGTESELLALSELRHLSIEGLKLATAANQLYFAPVFDQDREHASWIVTDSTRRNAQARRMDGEKWAKYDVKAKTLQGSTASWPLGISSANGHDIALVEGGPDLLAAWHCIALRGLRDRVYPVAMLGASNRIPDDALPMFAGKRVHIFEHNDGAGVGASTRWALQLTQSAVQIEDLSGQKDLNDLIIACEGDDREVPEPIGKLFASSGALIPMAVENWDEEQTTIDSPKTETKQERTARILKSRRVTAANKPAEPITRLFLAGKPIATPGNIQTLIAKAKQGKTAATGGAVAAVIAAHNDRPDMDTLGFTAPHTKEAVVLIDTEQSPYDTWSCQQRILSRAGEQKDPNWLCHYALVGMSVADKKEFFLAALKEAKEIHGGVFLVILDGVAHFVKSVNDEIECNEAAVWLRALSIEYDCPIMCIIHSNEGVKSGDDGRGHLGKQLTRDAESNLLLKKDGDITTITSEKQRKAPITEQDGIAFRWSDEAGRHVMCKPESSDKRKSGRPSSHTLSQFIDFFPAFHQKHSPLPILWKKCTSIAEIPRNTFRDLCEREFKNGQLDRIIDQNLGPSYRLNRRPGE